MTLTTIGAVMLCIGALILYAVAVEAFYALFGYIGAWAVWLFSFGSIRMDPLRGGESVLATWLGVIFILVVASGICFIFQRP